MRINDSTTTYKILADSLVKVLELKKEIRDLKQIHEDFVTKTLTEVTELKEQLNYLLKDIDK